MFVVQLIAVLSAPCQVWARPKDQAAILDEDEQPQRSDGDDAEREDGQRIDAPAVRCRVDADDAVDGAFDAPVPFVGEPVQPGAEREGEHEEDDADGEQAEGGAGRVIASEPFRPDDANSR